MIKREVIIGDCRIVLPTLPEKSFDCVVTDPPYGQTSLAWDKPLAAGDWLPEVARVLKPTGSIWIWGTLRSLTPLCTDAAALGWHMAQDVVWEKHNGATFHADRFRRVHEQAVQLYRGAWADVFKAPVFTNDATARTVRRKKRPPHTGNIGESHYTSIDGGPRLARGVFHARSCHGRAVHPTQKPVEVLLPLIKFSCPPGGSVLDPFAGSGTTGIAANILKRNATLIELNPDYAAMATERIEDDAPLLGLIDMPEPPEPPEQLELEPRDG